MLVEMWLAVTWFIYSYNPTENGTSLPSGVSTSRCLPSCLVADSILANIEHETEPSLDAVKCSFLSFLYEMCWDTNPGSECRPSVDMRIRSMAPFYRQTCLSNSCFALFSLSSAAENTVRAQCAPQFEALMGSLMRRDCHRQNDPEHFEKVQRIKDFKDCAQRQARSSCKSETLSFLDTFAAHVSDLCRQDNVHEGTGSKGN